MTGVSFTAAANPTSTPRQGPRTLVRSATTITIKITLIWP
jgi:hypothetical protein